MVVCGTPIWVEVPRVIELVCWMKTFIATRMAIVPMPAATPIRRTIGMPKTAANRMAKPAPASVPVVPFHSLRCAGKTHDFMTSGIERNVNFLISSGIVSSADMYAPTAMNATCPNDSTPELPEKICRPITIIRRRKSFSASFW